MKIFPTAIAIAKRTSSDVQMEDVPSSIFIVTPMTTAEIIVMNQIAVSIYLVLMIISNVNQALVALTKSNFVMECLIVKIRVMRFNTFVNCTRMLVRKGIGKDAENMNLHVKIKSAWILPSNVMA